MLIAVFAVLVSFSTLFVYVYQSNLMKQQQKMSVWPHLSYGPSWGTDYFTINLINKGIGPALVTSATIRDGDTDLDGTHSLMSLVPDSLKVSFSYSSVFPGQVLMAGEELRLFHITEPGTVQYMLNLLLENRISIQICYESVYGDSWITHGLFVEEADC